MLKYSIYIYIYIYIYTCFGTRWLDVEQLFQQLERACFGSTQAKYPDQSNACPQDGHRKLFFTHSKLIFVVI